jgi:putative flavoprotein involved in K+ transport
MHHRIDVRTRTRVEGIERVDGGPDEGRWLVRSSSGAAVDRFDGDTVVLRDGTSIRPDAVIAATGYRRGLEDVVGPLAVLDARGTPLVHSGAAALPGLFFLGYDVSLGGGLREIARGARRVARSIARDHP